MGRLQATQWMPIEGLGFLRGGLRLALAGLLGLALLAASPASALTITFDLDVEFSGATPPAGATPWMTITIDDAADPGGANSVRVTISNVNLTGTEFVELVDLNFDPALDPTQLTFTAVNMSAVGSVSFLTGVDAFMADGDGNFDLMLDLPPPPGNFAAKFTAGETIVFDLTYTAAITANSFDFLSAAGGGQGSFLAAAHVKGIGAAGEDSGWIGVPEPGTVLLGLGMLGLLAFRGRRN